MEFKHFVILIFMLSVAKAAPTEKTMESSKDIANQLPLCHKTDPDIDACLLNATNLIRDQLVAGIPSLGLPPLEPLTIPSVKLEQSNGMLSYKLILMDIVLRGLGNYNFTEIMTSFDNMTVAGKVNFSHVYLDAEYMLIGEFQMLPVEGSGRLMVNFTDNIATVDTKGALLKRREEYYYMNQDTSVSLSVGDVQANFENLYTGGDEKSMISKHIVDMHSEEIVEELKPAVETVLGMLLDDVASKFFKHLSFNKLFPS